MVHPSQFRYISFHVFYDFENSLAGAIRKAGARHRRRQIGDDVHVVGRLIHIRHVDCEPIIDLMFKRMRQIDASNGNGERFLSLKVDLSYRNKSVLLRHIEQGFHINVGDSLRFDATRVNVRRTGIQRHRRNIVRSGTMSTRIVRIIDDNLTDLISDCIFGEFSHGRNETHCRVFVHVADVDSEGAFDGEARLIGRSNRHQETFRRFEVDIDSALDDQSVIAVDTKRNVALIIIDNSK